MQHRLLNQKHPKYFLLIISFFFAFTDLPGQDLLDSVKSNSKLVLELKDTYRAFHINNIITEQKELLNLFSEDNSEKDNHSLLDSFINECESLKRIHFYNSTLNSYISQYLASTIQSYEIVKSKGFKSPDFKKDYEKYKTVKAKYLDYLYSNYSTSHFIDLSERKYWEINDKNNYIKSAQYSRYKSLKVNNLKSGLALLDSIIGHASDFQESCIYQIESADQYVKHKDILGSDADEIAIQKYKAILDQKKYCIYLFETWLKWRTVTQQRNGLSKTSEIPNDEYDKVREQVALVILEYVAKNEKDKMAINESLLMATHDIVKRFGEYQFGNQNTVEYHEIFDEGK
jgi:hypothetical protein